MQVLESYLAELHGLVESKSVYADPKAFMQDMRSYVLTEVNEDDLGIVPLSPHLRTPYQICYFFHTMTCFSTLVSSPHLML